MAFTSLHRMLGLPPSDLNFAMVEQAIADGVEEQDDLDWKRALPVKERHEEFAKDVAAMANSGGGTIVFGVGESDGPTSAAATIHDIDWSEAEESRLRRVAYTLIQPPVHPLEFRAVAHEGQTVVFLTIPPSHERPHLVWSQHRFIAPVRYGAQTEYMKERDLERAYRERLSTRAIAAQAFEDLPDRALALADKTERVWFAITAIPDVPRPSHLGRADRRTVVDLLIQTTSGTNPFTQHRATLDVNINPRPGHQMWRSRNDGDDLTSVAELHDNGTIVYARAMEPSRDMPDVEHFHPMDVQHTLAEAVWFLRQVAQTLGLSGRYTLRVTMHTQLPGPFYIRQFDHRGHLADAERYEPIGAFVPVEASFDPLDPEPVVLEALRDLTDSVLHQSGIPDAGPDYLKPSAPDAE